MVSRNCNQAFHFNRGFTTERFHIVFSFFFFFFFFFFTEKENFGTSAVVPKCYILLCPCVYGLEKYGHLGPVVQN